MEMPVKVIKERKKAPFWKSERTPNQKIIPAISEIYKYLYSAYYKKVLIQTKFSQMPCDHLGAHSISRGHRYNENLLLLFATFLTRKKQRHDNVIWERTPQTAAHRSTKYAQDIHRIAHQNAKIQIQNIIKDSIIEPWSKSILIF